MGTASKLFCERLQKMVDVYDSAIGEYIRTNGCNAHCVRKGGATHAVSCTTISPPLVSIALRGERSMKKVSMFTSNLEVLETGIWGASWLD